MWLTRISIKNPVFASMMMLALMVLGLFSWRELSVEEFPDIEFPYVMITTDYAGASPEAVESDVLEDVSTPYVGLFLCSVPNAFDDINKLLANKRK